MIFFIVLMGYLIGHLITSYFVFKFLYKTFGMQPHIGKLTFMFALMWPILWAAYLTVRYQQHLNHLIKGE